MHDPRVLDLVDEAIESGRTPEHLCASCPELLPEVHRLLRTYGLLEARLGPLPDNDAASDDAIHEGSALPPNPPGYQILSTLGAGGMGIVYLAHHVALDRQVAVKMLLAGPFARRVERERLLREARALATLRHPNIVCVHDVGEVEGRPFFTMEFMEGGRLADRLAGQPRHPEEAARIGVTLADAVSSAHAHGIVHRDLKPANILLAADGTLKVSDFGIARSSRAEPTLTHTGARLGTPSYMAPEQALGDGHEVGPATDVYALGAILYEMLTGRPPFRGATPAETERQLLLEDPVPPRLLVPGVPRDLETICLKSLRKEIPRRYPSARALSEDLGRFLRGEPIVARPVGRLERLGKWVRRHPIHTAVTIAAVVAVGAISSSVLWRASQRAAIERAVAEDLAEVVRLEGESDWGAARNTLARAQSRLAAAPGNEQLDRQATERQRELDLVDRLGEMHFERAASPKVSFDLAEWWRRYHDAFAQAELLHAGDTSEAFAARVAASPARTALVGAMDDWCICATSLEDLAWLTSATRLVDPDPAWRDRARDVAVLRDPAALEALVREASIERQPVSLLLTVVGSMHNGRVAEGALVLRRIQAAHPADFWANFALAEALDAMQDADAIGFYRAALALRPGASAVHAQLGMALAGQNRIDEAIACMQRSVAIDPDSARPQYNLATWLLRQRRFEEAVTHATIAARLDPQEPAIRGVLANALAKVGRYEEAAESLRRGIDLAPTDTQLKARLTRMLADCEGWIREAAAAAEGETNTPK